MGPVGCELIGIKGEDIVALGPTGCNLVRIADGVRAKLCEFKIRRSVNKTPVRDNRD